jgi:hypothetical protein
MAADRLGPMREERKRVQSEMKRVQSEIKRADALIVDLRQQTQTAQNLNRVMEGQLGMYQELNAQMG